MGMSVPLFIVVFPSLPHLEDSKVATEKVVNLYRERDVPVVDVADLVQDLPAKERIVSPMETHASELVNELVAEALYEMFIESGMIK